MSEYVLKLQKNIFLITALAAAILGASMAYFLSTGVRFWLRDAPASLDGGDGRNSFAGARSGTAYKPADEFMGLPTGDFFRNTASAADSSGEDDAPGATGEITLVGVLAGSADIARALIREDDQPNPQSFRIGQTAAGHKIVSIQPGRILVEAGGSRFPIKIGEKSGEARTAARQTQQSDSGDESESTEVIRLQRARLNAVLQDQTELMKNKMSPVQVDGRIAGWKLMYVPPDNLVHQLGARSGDILRRVNGQPLDSQERMFEIYNSLKTRDEMTVTIERGGRLITYDIKIE